MCARRGAGLAAVALLAGVASATPGHELVGVYRGWGAFRDRSPARCYAIAQPLIAGSRGRTQPFASVATWPGRGLRNSMHLRLSLERDLSAPVTVTVGERRFRLAASGRDAWATDAPSDRALVAAMRSGRSMSVEAVAAGGRPFADTYSLAGAATAIDAAALACAGR